MSPRDDTDARYVVRYGPTKPVIGALALGVIGLAVYLTMPIGGVTGVLGLVVFGAIALAALAVLAIRPVALVVDRDGLTLTAPLAQLRRPRHTIPWRDVQAIELFVLQTPGVFFWRRVRRRMMRVRMRSGSVRLQPGELRRTLRSLPGWRPEDLVGTRFTGGWRLDADRLARAVAAFAPGVRVEHTGVTAAPRFSPATPPA